MLHKLTKRQKIVGGCIAILVAVIYLGFCLYTFGAAWQRKEGDLPPVSPWLQDVGLFFVAFPFGFFFGLGLIAPILNALFWSTVAGLIYVLFSSRKVAA